MTRRFPLSQIIAAGALAVGAASAYAQNDVMRSLDHDYRVVTVAEGLVQPWSIAFLPDGDILVTELPGRLRIIRDGQLLPDPVPGVPTVHEGDPSAVDPLLRLSYRGQGGLKEVLPHPDFASNRLLYISYSKVLGDGNATTTSVIRGTFENDRFVLGEEIFEAVSETSQRAGHYGGKLAFDADGYLWVTVGDRQVSPSGNLAAHPAQDLRNHHGVVVRLHDDGRVPEDNPFVGRTDALPEIWSYGHRNAQGLAVDPENGNIWITEHGPRGGDELNLAEAGKNYGWPVIGYGVNYRGGTAIHASTHAEGMEQPARMWVPSIGTSGLAFYTGDKFPGWKGSLFAGGLVGQRLERFTLEGDGVVAMETLMTGVGRIRDVREGPDGYIYVAISNRRGGETPLVRLEPAGR